MRTMRKWLSGFMMLGIGLAAGAHGQGVETFSNSSATTSYLTNSFIGDAGFEWTFVHARNEGDFPINGAGLILRRSDEPSSLSAVIPGGIGDFSVDTRKAFTGNTQRRLELVINGAVVAQHEPAFIDGADDTVIPFEVTGINVSGDISLVLRLYGAAGNAQITLDNISWTGFGEDLEEVPPLISLSPSGASKAVFVGSSISFDVIASQVAADAEQETALTALSIPAGALFAGASGPAPVQSTFDWTPDVVGVYTAIFTAADSDGITTQEVVISVSADPDSPLPIVAGGFISQTFDELSTNATASLPAGWKVDKLTGVRAVGSYTAALFATERVGGNSLSASAGNGIYNFGAGVPNAAEDRAVGFLSSGTATKSGNLYLAMINNDDVPIDSLIIEYRVEKYRRGTNPDGFQIQLNFSTNGNDWVVAGEDFLTTFEPDEVSDGYAEAPGETVNMSGELDLSSAPIAPGSRLYLAWNYSVQNGTVTTFAQALAVDDVVVIWASEGPGPDPDPEQAEITGFTRSGADFVITFTGEVGATYQLEYTADLTNPDSWIGGPQGSSGSLTDVAPDAPVRFYRLIDLGDN
jgi:hypothetical protein